MIKLKDLDLIKELRIILRLFKNHKAYSMFYFDVLQNNYVSLIFNDKKVEIKFINNVYKVWYYNMYIDYNMVIQDSRYFIYRTLNKVYRNLLMTFKESELYDLYKYDKETWFYIKKQNNMITKVNVKLYEVGKFPAKVIIAKNVCYLKNDDVEIKISTNENFKVECNDQIREFVHELKVIDYVLSKF